MNITIKTIKSETKATLQGMINRPASLRSFFDRNIYPMYQNVQRERWMTENASEGARWKELNADYAKAKRTRFAQYPGRGTKMLIATNTLFQSVVGPGEGFKKIIEDRRMRIVTTVPYAKYVDEARTFTKFSRATTLRFRKALNQYIFRGKTFTIERVT